MTSISVVTVRTRRGRCNQYEIQAGTERGFWLQADSKKDAIAIFKTMAAAGEYGPTVAAEVFGA